MFSQKQKVSTMLEDFDRPIFVVNDQIYNKKSKIALLVIL